MSAKTNTKTTIDAIDADFRIIQNDISYIREDIKDIKLTLANNYVTVDKFEPVRKLVYGVVTLMLSAVVGALLTLVVRK